MNGEARAPVPETIPRVGVGVLLLDGQGRVLLTLRRRAPEAGYWSILGGKLDYLEKLEQCAVREAREEAGVEVELVRLLCVTDHLLPGEGQHWIAPAYLARVIRGEASNCEPEKAAEVRWFPLDGVPENLTMTARNAIEAYRREGPSSVPEIRSFGPITSHRTLAMPNVHLRTHSRSPRRIPSLSCP